VKITKRQLRRIIKEELATLNEGSFSDLDIEAMEQGTGRYADPDPLYPSPSKGFHQLSKTEFTWLTDAVESLQRRVNELEGA